MNILYGVPGEGMGHATRSKVIIDHLLEEGHEVHIVSSSRAYKFLNEAFPGKVTEIKGFNFVFKNAAVSMSKTTADILKKGPKNLFQNFQKHLEIKKKFKADLVITDFESFSFYYAKLYKLPVLSIDNMQVLDRCQLDIKIPTSEKKSFLTAKTVVKIKVPGCNEYIISSFFTADIFKKSTTLCPPIVRDKIIDAKPTMGDHIVVYQTSSSLAGIKEELSLLKKENFIVYGYNKNERHGNVIFKTFSEDGFIQDLASAKAVIANGGYSFISEAVYLHKPIYSFPIKNQFEQFLNAAYIEKCGYGRHFHELKADHLKTFLSELSNFKKNISVYKQNGNKVTFRKVDEFIFEWATKACKSRNAETYI